ncbi:hypothetical protein GCM10022221_25840 [Actinocorallia aurea]
MREAGRWSARGEAARRRILDAAAAELAAHGDVEVAAVARRAGVSAGLPYRYFGTRGGLLATVVGEFYDRLDAAASVREFPGARWHDRERARVEAWVGHLYDDPLAPAILGRLGHEAAVTDIEVPRRHRAVEMGAANMARGQRDGDLPADRDPELLAAAVLGGVQQAVALALGRTPRPDRARVTAELWAFVTGAVGAPLERGHES